MVVGVGEKIQSHEGKRSNRGAEDKVERFPHKWSLPTSTHQPEKLVCSLARTGGGWKLRFRLQRSDPRERTGVGCVNTAWRGLAHHSWLGGSLGKILELPKRQETNILGFRRRGYSEHHLNELHRRERASAFTADTRDKHESLRLMLQPPSILCASKGHYPHFPSREPVQLATARVPWSRDNIPRRTHGAPQAVAMSHWPLPPQAHHTFCTLASSGLSEPEPLNQLFL